MGHWTGIASVNECSQVVSIMAMEGSVHQMRLRIAVKFYIHVYATNAHAAHADCILFAIPSVSSCLITQLHNKLFKVRTVTLIFIGVPIFRDLRW